MDETLQGLTLEMKLDALGVQEGMKGLKRQLGVVNSEMKANLSAFDKSEKSMDRYETQLKGLNERLKVQKQMFNQAEGELKQLNANYLSAKNRVKDVEKAYLNLIEANKKNKASLDKSNSALKESNAELKKSETQYKRTTQRKEEAYQKLKQLRQAEKDLKNSNSATTAQLKRANEAVQKQSAKHKELVARYKEEGQQVKKLRANNETLSNSNQKVKNTYNKTNTELKQTENEFKELNNTIKNHNTNLAKAQKAVNNEKASLNNLERTIAKTKSEMTAFNKEQIIAGSHFTKTANQAEAMSKRFGHLGDKMTSIGRTMTVGVTTPITLGFGAALKTSADFEGQMSRVGAIAQASSKDLKAMSNQAVDLGAKTSKSANEVAKGMEELAALGFNAKQTMEAMPGVISAAEASGADMATTATVMASAINAFGLKASDASHVADLLAVSANDSAADIQYMGDALKYAGAPAKALGVSIEDTSAAIEIMSNSGLEGSQAGTALRASFIRLANPSKATAKEMEKLGIHLSDAKGEFVGMGSLIGQFQQSMKGMTREQKLANIATIVGTESASGFLALVEAGPKKINAYSKSLKNSNGESKKAADLMKDNLKGALEQLGGAFESLAIEVGRDLTPIIRAGAEGLTKFVEGFTSLPGWVRKATIGVTLFGAAIGPTLIAGGLLIRTIGSAAKGYASLNRRMAENSAEAIANASAQKVAAGSLATSGKTTKGATGLFGTLGNMLSLVTGRFGGLGKIVLKGTKLLGKAGLPLTILTTMFGVAYEKMGWFRQGFKDMGRIVNDVGSHINFSWIPNMNKAWNNLKDDMAKGLQDGALFKGIHKLFDGIHTLASKASDKVDVLGNGVSKETKGALKNYVKYSEKSNEILEKVRFNHGKISKKQAKQLIDISKKTSDDLIEQLRKREKKEIETAQKVLSETKVISDKRKRNIIQNIRKEGDIKVKATQELNRRISELENKAVLDGKLSEKETKELESLYRKRNDQAVRFLSKGEKEQQRILSRMSANRKAMSIEEASDTIKESIKARDRAKKDAKKRYDQRVDEINQMVGLSKTEKEKLLQEADDRYQKEKDKADKHHKKILKGVEDSNENVKREIDTSNGKVKSGFQKFWDGLKDRSKKAWGKMTDHAEDYGRVFGIIIKNLPKVVSKWFGKAYGSVKGYTSNIYEKTKDKFQGAKDKAESSSKSVWKSTSKWFGKTYGSVKGYTGSIYEKTKDKFQGAKDKAESSSKSVWKSTSKWFGKAYGSVKGYAEGMYSKAKSSFGDIASSAWDKAKSVYKGFHSWLSKTLSWIKNITSDFGKAASDLGKSVANKAVDGLNGMIGGINKIAKAITDKTLIKPIPRLSTGTYDGTTLPTDSNGGLKAPTLAVLNDKGSGNAPGGGVQEVIHRADGTLHAPQGKDVIVPLGTGDSVINADDTKRLQGMGLLPRFHSGSKKKDWLDQIKDKLGKKAGDFGAKAKNTAHNITEGAEDIVKAAGDKVKDGASWLGEKIGDAWDYVEHPGKLVEKVMSTMGINFGKGANATVQMAKGAYSLLKKKLVDKVKSWFEDFGGGGDGNYLFDYPIWQRFGRYTGGLNFNGGRHYGVDFGMPTGTNIYAVKGGIADRVWTDFGGGNAIQIKTGANEWNWYMHLSKQIARQGQRIKAGQLIAKSGATGNFVRGAHLHFQLMRGSHPGNDTAVDPMQWLKSLKGSAGAVGGSGYTNARNAILKAQAILGGRYRSPFITNEMLRVAKRESNYTSDAVNNWDINAQRGTPSKGMFQMIEPSFRAYAIRGHGNILNSVDEAISAMRYIVGKWVPIMGSWRSAFKRAGDYAYENGGLSTTHKLAQISEGNKPEMIVPLTKRTRAIQLIEQAMRYVGMETGTTNVTVNEDNRMVEKLLKQIVMLTDKGNKLTSALIQTVSSNDNSLNSTDEIRNLEKVLSKQSGQRVSANNYMGGLTS
ncbi:phage tail tape measure protein [Staphylococcus schleiferi]|uniref:phage tail tape measure protein n=1 Tax=Staphylococcus schleiferi TaxID=1295 RepID=UPI0021CEDD1B|nr:phage tail tape measure protein [Staphylococcus schleiferi]UXR54333.1 phage tail tape measure protein [Staphylococcus schleiferi]UXR61238.1 phage tail tape measure protein [Staphylococcus schleiferi]